MSDDNLNFRKERTREPRGKKVKRFDRGDVDNHFNDSIQSIEALFTTANQMIKISKTKEAENIWRSQIILLASAFDFYMHEITKYGLCEIQSGKEGWKMTDSYQRLPIPMKYVEMEIKSKDDEDENAWLLEFANDHYLHTSLISYKNIEEQLDLLGIDMVKVARGVYPDCQGNSRMILNQLENDQRDFCNRRNSIAHQTDKDSRDAEENGISEKRVMGFVTYIIKLVSAIDAAVEEKDNQRTDDEDNG